MRLSLANVTLAPGGFSSDALTPRHAPVAATASLHARPLVPTTPGCLRVLHVYQHYQPERGGIADFLADLTSELSDDTDQIVLTSSHGPQTRVGRVGPVTVVRAAAVGEYYSPLCPAWPRWIQRLRPDVLHIHLPCPMAELAALVARPRRLIVSLHNDYVRPRLMRVAWGPLHRAILRQADRVVVSSMPYAETSPALRAVWDDWKQDPVLAGRLSIIPYGVRVLEGDGEAEGAELRRQLGDRLVVFLGRLCYYKGVEHLIDAASGIHGQVLIVGDGDWRLRLERRAAGLQTVRFLGELPEPETLALLRAARVFVLPSTHRSEAFGLAQLKAMACGCPVVSTDLPGVSWVNRHGKTGLTVPPGDPSALATAINALLDDDALRSRLAEGARRRARELTFEQMCTAYRSLYRGCVDHAG